MKQRLYLILLCNFFFFCSVVAQNKMLNSPSRKLQLAEFAISNLYVDQVDENKLVESAIVKMLEQLDPHSTYSDPEEVKALNEPLQGNFDGIEFSLIWLLIRYLLSSLFPEGRRRKSEFWRATVLLR